MIFNGVTSVAETRQSVELKFWVQLPGNSPIDEQLNGRAVPSHGMCWESDSLLIYHISDWRSWLARLLDMEKVIGSNPISETTLHENLNVV